MVRLPLQSIHDLVRSRDGFLLSALRRGKASTWYVERLARSVIVFDLPLLLKSKRTLGHPWVCCTHVAAAPGGSTEFAEVLSSLRLELVWRAPCTIGGSLLCQARWLPVGRSRR